MPQNFVGCDREQAFLLPPDVRDWLPERHEVQPASGSIPTPRQSRRTDRMAAHHGDPQPVEALAAHHRAAVRLRERARRPPPAARRRSTRAGPRLRGNALDISRQPHANATVSPTHETRARFRGSAAPAWIRSGDRSGWVGTCGRVSPWAPVGAAIVDQAPAGHQRCADERRRASGRRLLRSRPFRVHMAKADAVPPLPRPHTVNTPVKRA
jgi:hypothetical protein